MKQLKESLKKKKPRSQMCLYGQACMPTYFFLLLDHETAT
jgi:hypothetical protein